MRVGASPEDRWLLCMPLFHVGGYAILFRSVLHGSGVVLHPRFDPKRVSRSLDNDGVTLASFVPTMLTAVLEARGGKPLDPKVRLIFLGGGQPPAGLVAAVRERRLPVLLTYGMTETCSQVALSRVSTSPAGPAYRSVFPSEVAVTRPGRRGKLELADPGEAGEVAVRGPTLFRGYWRKPALTRARLREGWFLTGDVGVLQPEGAARRAGRDSDTGEEGGDDSDRGGEGLPRRGRGRASGAPGREGRRRRGHRRREVGQRVVAALEANPEFRGASPRPPT